MAFRGGGSYLFGGWRQLVIFKKGEEGGCYHDKRGKMVSRRPRGCCYYYGPPICPGRVTVFWPVTHSVSRLGVIYCPGPESYIILESFFEVTFL